MPADILCGWTMAALALLSAMLALHPFTTYPLSLRLLARRSANRTPKGAPPASAAICVCAYNEQAVIAARVENLLALRRDFPNLEILVYVDAASDATARVLAPYADRLRLVISTERLGKTAGMNRLVGMSSAEIVVFSDANVTFAEDALTHLLAPFADPSIGCVCGHLRYTGQDGGSTAETGSLYWRLEERIKELETATGSVVGADGSIFAVRRRVHVPPPAHLIDDLFVSLSILCGGARVVRAPGALAYEAAVSRPGEEFHRKMRIACQAFNVHRALWPRLAVLPAFNLYKYLSHKLLRWLCIFFLSASAIFATAAVSLLAGATVGTVMLLAGAALTVFVATAARGPAARLREVLSALLATGLGVLRSCRGETFQTWNPPASARAATSHLTAQAGA